MLTSVNAPLPKTAQGGRARQPAAHIRCNPSGRVVRTPVDADCRDAAREGEPHTRLGHSKSHATCSLNARTAERANKVFAPRSQFTDADVDALVWGFPPARIIFRDHYGHAARRHQKTSITALNDVVGWRAVVFAAAFERVPVMGVGIPWPDKQPCPDDETQTTRHKVTQSHSWLARTGPRLNCDGSRWRHVPD